jgi:calcineurin-like phosphoesterase family protein
MKIARQGRSHDMIRSGKLKFYGPPEKNVSINKVIYINGQQIHISHYAQRTWLGAFRGGWHLFGHSHTNLEPMFKSMDVGVDNNNYFPFHFDEIKCFMDNVSDEFTEKDQ